jgi:hypothetical protein
MMVIDILAWIAFIVLLFIVVYRLYSDATWLRERIR